MKSPLNTAHVTTPLSAFSTLKPSFVLLGKDDEEEMVDIPGGITFENWLQDQDDAGPSSSRQRSTLPEALDSAASGDGPDEDAPESRTEVEGSGQGGSRPSATSAAAGGAGRRLCGRPDRQALRARYRTLMAMPDEELTAEEKAEVRQNLILKILRRVADNPNIRSQDLANLASVM